MLLPSTLCPEKEFHYIVACNSAKCYKEFQSSFIFGLSSKSAIKSHDHTSNVSLVATLPHELFMSDN